MPLRSFRTILSKCYDLAQKLNISGAQDGGILSPTRAVVQSAEEAKRRNELSLEILKKINKELTSLKKARKEKKNQEMKSSMDLLEDVLPEIMREKPTPWKWPEPIRQFIEARIAGKLVRNEHDCFSHLDLLVLYIQYQVNLTYFEAEQEIFISSREAGIASLQRALDSRVPGFKRQDMTELRAEYERGLAYRKMEFLKMTSDYASERGKIPGSSAQPQVSEPGAFREYLQRQEVAEIERLTSFSPDIPASSVAAAQRPLRGSSSHSALGAAARRQQQASPAASVGHSRRIDGAPFTATGWVRGRNALPLGPVHSVEDAVTRIELAKAKIDDEERAKEELRAAHLEQNEESAALGVRSPHRPYLPPPDARSASQSPSRHSRQEEGDGPRRRHHSAPAPAPTTSRTSDDLDEDRIEPELAVVRSAHGYPAEHSESEHSESEDGAVDTDFVDEDDDASLVLENPNPSGAPTPMSTSMHLDLSSIHAQKSVIEVTSLDAVFKQEDLFPHTRADSRRQRKSAHDVFLSARSRLSSSHLNRTHLTQQEALETYRSGGNTRDKKGDPAHRYDKGADASFMRAAAAYGGEPWFSGSGSKTARDKREDGIKLGGGKSGSRPVSAAAADKPRGRSPTTRLVVGPPIMRAWEKTPRDYETPLPPLADGQTVASRSPSRTRRSFSGGATNRSLSSTTKASLMIGGQRIDSFFAASGMQGGVVPNFDEHGDPIVSTRTVFSGAGGRFASQVTRQMPNEEVMQELASRSRLLTRRKRLDFTSKKGYLLELLWEIYDETPQNIEAITSFLGMSHGELTGKLLPLNKIPIDRHWLYEKQTRGVELLGRLKGIAGDELKRLAGSNIPMKGTVRESDGTHGIRGHTNFAQPLEGYTHSPAAAHSPGSHSGGPRRGNPRWQRLEFLDGSDPINKQTQTDSGDEKGSPRLTELMEGFGEQIKLKDEQIAKLEEQIRRLEGKKKARQAVKPIVLLQPESEDSEESDAISIRRGVKKEYSVQSADSDSEDSDDESEPPSSGDRRSGIAERIGELTRAIRELQSQNWVLREAVDGALEFMRRSPRGGPKGVEAATQTVDDSVAAAAGGSDASEDQDDSVQPQSGNGLSGDRENIYRILVSLYAALGFGSRGFPGGPPQGHSDDGGAGGDDAGGTDGGGAAARRGDSTINVNLRPDPLRMQICADPQLFDWLNRLLEVLRPAAPAAPAADPMAPVTAAAQSIERELLVMRERIEQLFRDSQRERAEALERELKRDAERAATEDERAEREREARERFVAETANRETAMKEFLAGLSAQGNAAQHDIFTRLETLIKEIADRATQDGAAARADLIAFFERSNAAEAERRAAEAEARNAREDAIDAAQRRALQAATADLERRLTEERAAAEARLNAAQAAAEARLKVEQDAARVDRDADRERAAQAQEGYIALLRDLQTQAAQERAAAEAGYRAERQDANNRYTEALAQMLRESQDASATSNLARDQFNATENQRRDAQWADTSRQNREAFAEFFRVRAQEEAERRAAERVNEERRERFMERLVNLLTGAGIDPGAVGLPVPPGAAAAVNPGAAAAVPQAAVNPGAAAPQAVPAPPQAVPAHPQDAAAPPPAVPAVPQPASVFSTSPTQTTAVNLDDGVRLPDQLPAARAGKYRPTYTDEERKKMANATLSDGKVSSTRIPGPPPTAGFTPPSGIDEELAGKVLKALKKFEFVGFNLAKLDRAHEAMIREFMTNRNCPQSFKDMGLDGFSKYAVQTISTTSPDIWNLVRIGGNGAVSLEKDRLEPDAITKLFDRLSFEAPGKAPHYPIGRRFPGGAARGIVGPGGGG